MTQQLIRFAIASFMLTASLPAFAQTWSLATSVPTNSDFLQALNGVAYGGGRWTAVGGWMPDGPSGKLGILTSTNATTWSRVSAVPPDFFPIFNSVHYGNGRWVAVGKQSSVSGTVLLGMATSTNGTTWSRLTDVPTQSQYAQELKSVAYGNGRWIAVGKWPDGFYPRPLGILTSINGTSWSVVSGIPSNSQYLQALNGVAYGNGRWVAVGGWPTGSGTRPLGILTSTNGTSWTVATDVPSNSDYLQVLNAVAYGNGRWVAVGKPMSGSPTAKLGILTSTNGTTWRRATNVPANFLPSFQSVQYANGRWYAVGLQSSVSGTVSLGIAMSTNGTTWTKVTSVPSSSQYSQALNSVFYGNNRWVTVGGWPSGTGERPLGILSAPGPTPTPPPTPTPSPTPSIPSQPTPTPTPNPPPANIPALPANGAAQSFNLEDGVWAYFYYDVGPSDGLVTIRLIDNATPTGKIRPATTLLARYDSPPTLSEFDVSYLPELGELTRSINLTRDSGSPRLQTRRLYIAIRTDPIIVIGSQVNATGTIQLLRALIEPPLPPPTPAPTPTPTPTPTPSPTPTPTQTPTPTPTPSPTVTPTPSPSPSPNPTPTGPPANIITGDFTVIYHTDFTVPPFTLGANGWAVADGWETSDSTSGAQGILADSAGSAAYTGQNPPESDVSWTWRAFTYDPLIEGNGSVRLTTRLAVIDSTNEDYDQFLLQIYNRDLELLASLTFDNATLELLRSDGENITTLTESFSNGTSANLDIAINFRGNVWTATLDGRPLFVAAPFHGGQYTIDLGEIDFVWSLATPGSPGDNFLRIDNFTLAAGRAPALVVTDPPTRPAPPTVDPQVVRTDRRIANLQKALKRAKSITDPAKRAEKVRNLKKKIRRLTSRP